MSRAGSSGSPDAPGDAPASAGTAELFAALRAAVRGEVDVSRRRRAEYSSDASNYRVVPQVVVFPRDVDDLLAVHQVARAAAVPLTMRGGGTSVAGNAVGPGIVVDSSRHLTSVLEVDPYTRTARVEPGVVLDALQAAGRPRRLRFGPDPSTHSRATLGGMIGNNACGPHAIAYGRTAENVIELDVVDGTGRRFTAGTDLSVLPGLEDLLTASLAVVRTEFGRFGRQVSGYSLEHLLPERGGSLAKALVGSEGSLVTVLGASVRLVDTVVAPALVVLGYLDIAAAADAVPALLRHAPLALEGLDARLVDAVRARRGARARVPELPAGGGWLMVEMGGSSPQHARDRANRLVRDSGCIAARVLPAGDEAIALWRIREDGAGLAGRTPSGAPAWPGWEDAAVPPDRLGGYLREFAALTRSYGLEGVPYGHFGDGCVHVRLDVPLELDSGVETLRSFVADAARLVSNHGGSLSGEHGDGRARSALLPSMYSPAALDLMAAVKHLFDPRDVLNPGVVVRPRAVDVDLRRPHAHPLPRAGGFAFRHDAGDFTTAVHRCVGVGKCRADDLAAGAFMCPSFLATGDEKDSTRGRARVLQEMANGTLVTRGWRAPQVREVLDLCLSCKACSRDCPAGVDMAQYKAEVLHRAYRRRPRPRSHYSLGWLPAWLRLARHLPRALNASLRVRPIARVLLWAGGLDTRRRPPALAARGFRARHRSATPSAGGPRGPVVLWVDSFSDAFAPDAAQAAIDVLHDAGYEVVVPRGRACCGLTWISTGQLDTARRRLRELVDVLGPYAAEGVTIVGVEPSCTAVLRSDLAELLEGDPRAGVVGAATRTLAEVLLEACAAGWVPPRLDGLDVLAQPHCHQHSVMGYDADQALLESAGANVTTLAGCCGLAGNFGMEKGHYDVSVAVARTSLLPALEAATPDAVFLADGFSCRTQAADLAGVRGVHLAELLASRLGPPAAR